MKSQNFGIEIELTGITRKEAATVMANYFGITAVDHEGGTYDTYCAFDGQGRKWKAMSDASIRKETKDGQATQDRAYSCEIVSPICQYTDIETIQEIVRLLRKAGARVNSSCGIHVHIDAAPHTAQSLRNLANIFASREDMLVHALGIETARMSYCRRADKDFMARLNRSKPSSRSQLQGVWYNGTDESHIHYSQTRYRMLNFHSVFSKGTVEFTASIPLPMLARSKPTSSSAWPSVIKPSPSGPPPISRWLPITKSTPSAAGFSGWASSGTNSRQPGST